ncbi:MAG: hypothetical protein SPJ68_05560 [Arcanobacterium sp.]|nr:hypothetical protein [Arcanobacterium sp.]
MRDFIVYGMLALLMGGALLWMVYSIVTGNKGQWSAHARELGEFRARRWAYRESVPSLKAHLIPDAPDTHYWPALANARGTEGLSGTEKTSGIEWNAALAETIGERPRLYITARFPQQLDAREVDVPEFLVARDGAWAGVQAGKQLDLSASAQGGSADGWRLITAEPDAASEVLTQPVRAVIANLDGLAAFHAVHDCATFVLTPEKTAADRVNVIEYYIRAADQLAHIIPENFWV